MVVIARIITFCVKHLGDNMTQQNLVLTEKAIKNHCKRLKKELLNYQQDLSLCEIQNLFAKTLGFNHYHELKNILDKNNTIEYTQYEKFVIVILSLILDNQRQLAFDYLNNYPKEGMDTFLMNVLFDKYKDKLAQQTSSHTVIIDLIGNVRKKMPFACSYFISLREVDIKLWKTLFLTGRLNVNEQAQSCSFNMNE